MPFITTINYFEICGFSLNNHSVFTLLQVFFLSIVILKKVFMKHPIVIAIALLFFSCQTKSEKVFKKLETMNWLIGQWENKTPEGYLTEPWAKANDSTFLGQTYFIINEKDTVHAENIVLTQLKDELIYRPTIKGQNNDGPIDFLLTSDTENNFVFENQKHDYPQKITYKKVNNKSLVAIISGVQEGKPSTESYPMTKK